jgi:hypothetical protein
MVVLQNSDEKHGFFRSAMGEKAAVRYREIPVNLMMQIGAGKSPQQSLVIRMILLLIAVIKDLSNQTNTNSF